MQLGEVIYSPSVRKNPLGYSGREGDPFRKKIGTPRPNWPNIGVKPRILKFLASLQHVDLQIILRHDNKVLMNILRLSRGPLDHPVKNKRALTEVDPSPLDTEFSRVTVYLLVGMPNDVLGIETPFKRY